MVLLKQARLALWNSLHDFKIRNVSINNFKYYYLDNQTLESRAKIFSDHESLFEISRNFREFDSSIVEINALNSLLLNSKLADSYRGKSLGFMINTILEDSELKIDRNAHLYNCSFKSSKIEVGENTLLNDVSLVNNFFKFTESTLTL